jgi:hypothetical protein
MRVTIVLFVMAAMSTSLIAQTEQAVHVVTKKGNTCDLAYSAGASQKKYQDACDEITAHPFDGNKEALVHVVTESGNTCDMKVYGSDKPDADTLKSMRLACDRQARGKAILALTGPTDRDFAGMSAAQKQQYLCNQVRSKIEVEKDVEAAGSNGLYNLDYLLSLERQECGSNAP